MKKQRSKLWSDDILVSSIQSQMTVRICGTLSLRSEIPLELIPSDERKEGSTEFAAPYILKQAFKNRLFKGINTNNNKFLQKHSQFIKVPPEVELIMRKNFAEFLETMSGLLRSLPFKVMYSFLCLFSKRVIHVLDYSLQEYKRTLERIKMTLRKERSRDAVDTMEFAVQNVAFDNRFWREGLYDRIMKLYSATYDHFSQYFDDIQMTDKLVRVRKVVVTPSRIELDFPFLNSTNRAIRNNLENIDDFIRVSFMSEDYQKGNYSFNYSDSEGIFNHLRNVLEDGFKIGGKTFKFLHYSNSQLKSYSCWFMNEVKPHLTYNRVIQELGNFNGLGTVSKNAARRGQAFSSTIKTVSLDSKAKLKFLK